MPTESRLGCAQPAKAMLRHSPARFLKWTVHSAALALAAIAFALAFALAFAHTFKNLPIAS